MNSTYFSISRANGFSFSGVSLRECEKKADDSSGRFNTSLK
ncbi:hypothetical protein [Klebsiella pneumoniae IS22]|nr:hypothetical protein [Klebsiella pneumoniae IS22]